MQCDAKSSVADAKAMLIFERDLPEFSSATTAAKAVASPAMERAECNLAFSNRALSFLFNVLLLVSFCRNHFPIDTVLLALEDFVPLGGCQKEYNKQKK